MAPVRATSAHGDRLAENNFCEERCAGRHAYRSGTVAFVRQNRIRSTILDLKGRVLGTVAQPAAIPSSFSALSDSALAIMVAGGDEHAFEVLYRRHRDGLFRFCRSITGSPEDAEEAFQAAMLSAYGALRGGARATPVRPWLFRIAHNASVSVLRLRRVGPASGDLESASDPLAGIHERVEHRERLRELIDDFGRLPVRQRAALAMREIEGLSHAAVARALDTTPLDARHLVHSARSALTEQDAGRDERCDHIRGLVIAGDRRVLRGRRIGSHLRACEGCRVFAAADRDRRAGLGALAPLLPFAASERILKGILHPASGSTRATARSAWLTGGRVVRIIGASVGAGATATVVGMSALVLGLWSHDGYSADVAQAAAHRPAPVNIAGGSPIRSLSREPRIDTPPPRAAPPASAPAVDRRVPVALSRSCEPPPRAAVTITRAEVGMVQIVSVGDIGGGVPAVPAPTDQPLQTPAAPVLPAVAAEASPAAPPAEPPTGSSVVAPPGPLATIISVVAPPPGVRAPDTKNPPRPAPKGSPTPHPVVVVPTAPRAPKVAGPASTRVSPAAPAPSVAAHATTTRAPSEAPFGAADPGTPEEAVPPAAEIPPPAAVVEPSALEPAPDPNAPPAAVVEVAPALPTIDLAPPAVVVETAAQALPGESGST